MAYSKELIAGKLRRWERYLSGQALPLWEELPSIDLYMDQVIALLGQYLSFLPQQEDGEKVVTVSAINNYVRLKAMPPPRKKKYSRVHMAYLIMICTLKQSMSIADIQRMIPLGLSLEQVQMVYDEYVQRHRTLSIYFIEQVRKLAARVLDPKDTGAYTVENLVMSMAILSGLSGLLTEKLVRLQNVTEADVSFPGQQ